MTNKAQELPYKIADAWSAGDWDAVVVAGRAPLGEGETILIENEPAGAQGQHRFQLPRPEQTASARSPSRSARARRRNLQRHRV